MQRQKIIALALAAALSVLAGPLAMADYIDPDGNVVRWAGGNNIIVTDPNGEVIYSGEGVRIGDRLVMPNLTPEQTAAALQTVSVPHLAAGQEAAYLAAYGSGSSGGTSGSTSSGSSSSSSNYSSSSSNSSDYYSSVPSSPYPNASYIGMQPVVVTGPDGSTITTYANIYYDPTTGRYLSAVPSTYSAGSILAQNGFQVSNGMVLLSPSANSQEAGRTVSWSAQVTATDSQGNLLQRLVSAAYGAEGYAWGGGGQISINLPPEQQQQATAPVLTSNQYYVPSPGAVPDQRSLAVRTDLPLVRIGGIVVVTATLTGTAEQILLALPWGEVTGMQHQGGPTYTAIVRVPEQQAPGQYPFTVGAMISQPPHYPAQSFIGTVQVSFVKKSPGIEIPLQGNQDEIPDWWTPPNRRDWTNSW